MVKYDVADSSIITVGLVGVVVVVVVGPPSTCHRLSWVQMNECLDSLKQTLLV